MSSIFKGLSSIGSLKSQVSAGTSTRVNTAGTKGDKYGKIQDNCLLYNGKWFEISLVGNGVLFLETQNELFGENGDEFPISLIR